MFVRKQTVKGITYQSLVENRWDALRRRHVHVKIASPRKADDPTGVERVRRIVSSLTSFCQTHGIATHSAPLGLAFVSDINEPKGLNKFPTGNTIRPFESWPKVFRFNCCVYRQK